MTKTTNLYDSTQLSTFYRAFRFVTLILFFCISLTGLSSQADDLKVHLQVIVNLGSPVNNLGCRLVATYQVDPSAELALGYSITYNLRNYGPKKRHLEHSILGSAHYLWADQSDPIDDFTYIKYIDSRSTLNSLGYTWERYFNKIGTTQNVGTIHFRLDKTILQFSNDAFANTDGKDRFRTGAFNIGWLENDTYYYSKLLIWVGDFHCKAAKKYKDTDYPARWGYKDISECNYGNLSHGILSFGAMHDVGGGQMAGIDFGIDAEQIRNTVQNKVIHDMYFIPNFMNKTKNLHIPMKTKNGENYMFLEDQEIRAARFVWQLSLNPSSLY